MAASLRIPRLPVLLTALFHFKKSLGAVSHALFACSLLAAGETGAGCGLSFCPKPEGPGERNLELGLMAKETGFDIGGTEGRYTELMATLQYTAWGKVAFGLHAPFIILEADGTEAGLGNFIAYAEWRGRPDFLAALAGGVQLEMPMGGAHHGLGDDHWMAVPYVSAARHAGPLMLSGALGALFSISGGHEDGHHHAGAAAAPVYVHPHEPLELLYRASAGASLLSGRFLPEAFLDGQRVLGDPEVEGADLDFLALGVTLPWQWAAVTLAPNAAVPLLSRDRWLWSAGLTVSWKIGVGRTPPPGEA